MASQRVEFPLPECALPSVRVTPEQHEELRAFAVRTAQEVLRDGPTWGRSNVNAARDRGWKVSQRSPEVCFMMKTTTTSKPVKPVKKSTSSSSAFATTTTTTTTTAPSVHHAFSTHTNSSVSSSGESPRDIDLRPTTTTTTTTRGLGGAGGRAFMGSVRLVGHSLDDVISAIHCENTKAQRRQLSKSYGAAYLDCCVMQTLESAKPHDPFWYLGLKWTALKTPFEKIVNHREFVYLEHSGTHVNAHGQRVLYRIIQSVCLDDFGGERCYFGLTRAHLEAAYVYWMDTTSPSASPLSSSPLVVAVSNHGDNDDSGVLTVCMKGLAHPKGKVPLFLIERLMKKFWKAGWTLHTSTTITGVGVGVAGTDHVKGKQPHDSHDTKKLTLGLATQWVADADRKNCALCHKKFRFGRRMRHHCRACGEVICRSCTQYFLLTYAGSVGSYPIQSHHDHGHDQSEHQQHHDKPQSKNGYRNPGRTPNHQFAGYSGHDDDDEDDLPATLGDDGGRQTPYSRHGRRLRGSSENDAVMVGKVCRRCVELKQVEVRRETAAELLQPPASYPETGRRTGNRISSSTRVPSRRTGVHYARNSNHGARVIQETDDEHDPDDGQDNHHDFPIMGHEDDDGDFFVPETPLPSHTQRQPQQHHQFHLFQQHHEDDDTTSEFSIGDFDQSSGFKPFATLDLKSAHGDDEHDSRQPGTGAGGHQGVLRGQAGKVSIDSSFSQSGFSVGVHAYDNDDDDSSDNEDEFVDYHSEPDHELEPVTVRVHHPQLGQLTHLEEERFTMPRVVASVAHQRQHEHQRPVPPPIAQQFALTAAALSAPRYTQPHPHARRLRIEDLLADTDDEGEEDYSTSPPLRPSALNVASTSGRPQPQLTRTTSAPPMSMDTREREAPPPLPMPSYHYHHHRPHASSHANRESNLSSISFSSFDADFLIDATALDDDEDDEHDQDAEYRRQSTTIDEGDDSESEEILFARIQKIQDEVLRRQLLSSSASSVASSVLSSPLGPTTIRFNRNTRAPSSGVPPNSISLSESSTISSNGSFLSTPSSLPETATATAPMPRASVAGVAPRAAKRAHKAMQLQVESSIADQAQLLYYIQKQRAATGITSP